MIHFLIFGANGMLGSYLNSYFSVFTSYNVIPITRKEFDVSLDKISSVYIEEFIQSILLQYTILSGDQIIVFNAIGLINAVKATNDEFLLINSHFPISLSYTCVKNNWKLMHASTDCVFDGKTNSWYTEDDNPNSTDIYGISKQNEPKQSMIIRCSIIGLNKNHTDRGFMSFLLNSRDNVIDGYTNHKWNGITCLEYSKMIHYLIKKNIYWTGVRHIDPGYEVSKYEMCKIVNDIFDLNITINPIETTEPSNKVLRSNYSWIPITDFETQIKELYLYDLP